MTKTKKLTDEDTQKQLRDIWIEIDKTGISGKFGNKGVEENLMKYIWRKLYDKN